MDLALDASALSRIQIFLFNQDYQYNGRPCPIHAGYLAMSCAAGAGQQAIVRIASCCRNSDRSRTLDYVHARALAHNDGQSSAQSAQTQSVTGKKTARKPRRFRPVDRPRFFGLTPPDRHAINCISIQCHRS